MTGQLCALYPGAGTRELAATVFRPCGKAGVLRMSVSVPSTGPLSLLCSVQRDENRPVAGCNKEVATDKRLVLTATAVSLVLLAGPATAVEMWCYYDTKSPRTSYYSAVFQGACDRSVPTGACMDRPGYGQAFLQFLRSRYGVVPRDDDSGPYCFVPDRTKPRSASEGRQREMEAARRLDYRVVTTDWMP